MLAAEFHGKIGAHYAPSQRMEDVLTSDVFSVFRYLDDPTPGLAWLKLATNTSGETLDTAGADRVEVVFWPSFGSPNVRGTREPDLLMLLKSPDGDETAIVVECKYNAPLSNRHGPGGGVDPESGEVDDEDVRFDSPLVAWGHQLADEYLGLFETEWRRVPTNILPRFLRAKRRLLLYVTCHDTMPESDLEEAERLVIARRAATENPTLPVDPGKSMFWVPWASMHDVLAGFIGQVRSPGARNLLQDVRNVLEVRGLTPFRPFLGLEMSLPAYESLSGGEVISFPVRTLPAYVPLWP